MSGKVPGDIAVITAQVGNAIFDTFLILTIEKKFGDVEVISRMLMQLAKEQKALKIVIQEKDMARNYFDLSTTENFY